jgi:hypothetical protein
MSRSLERETVGARCGAERGYARAGRATRREPKCDPGALARARSLLAVAVVEAAAHDGVVGVVRLEHRALELLVVGGRAGLLHDLDLRIDGSEPVGARIACV